MSILKPFMLVPICKQISVVIITRNAVIVLYVLLECLKWISTLLSLAL